MGSNLGVCPNIFRVIFCIVNLIVLLIGLAGVGVGIYLLVSNQTFAFITGNTIVSGAVIILIAGACAGIIAGVGIVGALFKWRPLLIIYVVVLTVVVVLEIAAGILGYVFRNQLESLTRSHIANVTENLIMDYRFSQPQQSLANNLAVDGVQTALQCCGSTTGPGDWLVLNPNYFVNSSGRFPMSCDCTPPATGCVSFNDTTAAGQRATGDVWSMPCTNVTNDRVLTLAYVAGGIGIAFGVVEIFGILVGIGLCLCITMAAKDKEMV